MEEELRENENGQIVARSMSEFRRLEEQGADVIYEPRRNRKPRVPEHSPDNEEWATGDDDFALGKACDVNDPDCESCQ